MKLTTTEVNYISHLARLDLDPSDAEKYTHDLSNILGLANQMDQIDTANIQPLAHPFDCSQRLREDIITECNQRELFQTLTPNIADGFYLVPQVINP